MRHLVVFAVLAACNGFTHPDQPSSDPHPIANAGIGSSYPLGSTVTLDGSRSFDPAGTIVAYHWDIGDHPADSTSQPASPGAMTTTVVLDQLGTYRARLTVTDDAGNADTAEVRLVAIGAIQNLDAGAPASVAWLATAQLAGTAAIVPGKQASYAWTFLARPAGSTTTLEDATSLTPSFIADAAGTYVLALDAAVGDETREDTVTVEATAPEVTIGSGAAYAYATTTDRVLYAHDVGHAELVSVDPMTGTTATANVGDFAPHAIALADDATTVAVGGLSHFGSSFGEVATAVVSTLAVTGDRLVVNDSADQIVIASAGRVDCYRLGAVTAVDMVTSQDVTVSFPAQAPFLATSHGDLFLLDAASSELYLLENGSLPPGQVLQHTTVAGIAPPIFGLGASQPYVLAGAGQALDASGTVRYDLHMTVTAAAQNPLGTELAVVSESAIRVFSLTTSTPTLVFSAVVPHGTTRLVAYSADGHRLIIVADDVAFTVPR